MRSIRNNWISEFDGLRALACGAVVYEHFNALRPVTNSPLHDTWESSRIFSQGSLGVIFFFSLSSFLLTYLGVTEWQKTGGFSIKGFFFRRALRIYPLYFVTIAAYAVMWFTVKQSLPADVINGGGTFPEWVRQLPFYLTFTQNWSYPNFTDMGILWSLGVEEQFYLAFPFVFLLAATRGWFLHIVAALIVAAVTWRLSIMTFAPHHYVYYVTPTYFDVFALGAVAGWLAATGNIPKLLTLPGIGSLIVIALVTLGYLAHDNLFQPYKLWTAWIYSGLAITNAAALLWVVSNPNSITSQALRTAMMSKLGRISFGVYMWHIIARTIVTVIWPQTADGDVYFISFFAAYVGLSVLLATASYWLIEKPFLSFKKSTSPASSLATV